MEPFRIPGTSAPEIVVRRSAFGSISVSADGQPVKRARSRTLTYEIPLTDGTTKPIELKGQFSGLRAVVDGTEIPLEPKLRPWELMLVYLPFALIFVGGLIGGVVGGIGFLINNLIARSAARGPVKAIGMLAIALVAVVAWYAIAYFVSPVPTMTAGTCLNGIGEGVVVTTSTARSVPCESPHDNEVIATFDYPAGGSYPDDATFQAFVEARCIPAFATYVGIEFSASTLDMIPVRPSNETWQKGDRQVACVVLTSDGTQLQKSVKGARL